MPETLDTLTVGGFFDFPTIVGEVGVEVEVEANVRLPTRDDLPLHWVRMHDGSLRGMDNGEYVFKKPKKRRRRLQSYRLSLQKTARHK